MGKKLVTTNLENSLDEIQQIAHIGLWRLDLKSNDLHWTDEIFRIFEIDPLQFKATYASFLNCIHPDDRKKVDDAYTESLHSKRPYDIVHRLHFPQGRIKYVRERCRTEFSEEGTPLVSYGTVQDITSYIIQGIEKEEAERRCLVSSKMASLGELAGGLAHEINNPLSILRGYNDIFLRRVSDCPDEELKKKFGEIVIKEKDAIERLTIIVSSLKNYIHSEGEDSVPFDLVAGTKSSLDFVRLIYEKYGIRFSFTAPEEKILVRGFPNYYQQILMNLYSNAKDAMEHLPEGKIDVVISKEGETVFIKISDQGLGIKESDLKNLFKKNFTTKEAGKGTGLGLNLSRRFAGMMNGTLGVESQVGKGTTFTISFPIESSDHLKKTAKRPEELQLSKLGKKVLVVDDEQGIVDYLQFILSESGCSVTTASNGKEALELLKNHPFDCLFTDIVMPVMSGQELINQLPQIGFQGKCVVVSGSFFHENYRAQLRYDHFVEKPFTRQDINIALKKVFF